MTFTLTIDGPRWRSHLAKVVGEYQSAGVALLPVVKGNGYGLGQALLAQEVGALGLPALAVGTIYEAKEMLGLFNGDVVVLEPFEPTDIAAAERWQSLASETRLVRTVQRESDLAQSPHRVRFEVATNMARFGGSDKEISTEILRTLHLAPGLSETEALTQVAAVSKDASISISHVSLTTAKVLRERFASVEYRIGTALWLGDRAAIQAHGTVLEVRRPKTNSQVGYRKKSASAGSSYAIVSGGTSHGLGLEVHGVSQNFRQQLIAIVTGVLSALGKSRSPFKLGSKRLNFVEPPHQHVSMVWLPNSERVEVGQQLTADVRFTITRADRVTVTD